MLRPYAASSALYLTKDMISRVSSPSSPRSLASMAREIRRQVGRKMALPLVDVAFVRRGRIPKTTSGKVQRRELQRRYIAGQLERLDV